jgi:diaminopimelate decarboxylase
MNESASLAARQLSGDVKTPFYFLDLDAIRESFLEFRRVWTGVFPRFKVAYAYKANALKAVTRIFSELGGCAEVISGAELGWALEDGVPGDRIFFDGATKSAEDLELAVARGVNVNVDSVDEVKLLAAICDRTGGKASVTVRLSATIQDGSRSRFGLTREELFAADRILGDSGLQVSGLHVHIGTNVNDPMVRIKELSDYADVFRWLHGRAAPAVRLNIGGGFAARSKSRTVNVVPMAEYAGAVASFLESQGIDRSSLELVAEPGRYLVEDHGCLVTRVCATKRRNEKEILVVDAWHDLIRLATTWYHPITILRHRQPDPGPAQRYVIYGTGCFEHDLVSRGYDAPRAVGVGDVLAVGSTGGYEMAASIAWTRAPAAAYGLYQGALYLLRDVSGNPELRRLHRTLDAGPIMALTSAA